MGYLKGKSSLMIFEHYANLKYKFGSKTFQATGYYVSTVGLNEATIRKYIREQENEDMMKDKLTKKEYLIIIPLKFTLNKKNIKCDKIYLERTLEVFFHGKTKEMDFRRESQNCKRI